MYAATIDCKTTLNPGQLNYTALIVTEFYYWPYYSTNDQLV